MQSTAGLRSSAALVFWAAAVWAADSPLRATIVDRMGNQHQVSKLSYQGRTEIEYFVDEQPRTAQLADVARLRLEGEREDEEARLILTWRNGATERVRSSPAGRASPPTRTPWGAARCPTVLAGSPPWGLSSSC